MAYVWFRVFSLSLALSLVGLGYDICSYFGLLEWGCIFRD